MRRTPLVTWSLVGFAVTLVALQPGSAQDVVAASTSELVPRMADCDLVAQRILEEGIDDPNPHLPLPSFEGCTGQIRPGAPMTAPVGCTYNFVFTGGGNTYIGTAGHCVGVGARVSTSVIGAFGTVVMSVNGGLGNDFALIRVDADKVGMVNPRLCTWGGPTTVHQGGVTVGSPLFEYGWGIATSSTAFTRARALSAFTTGANSASWNGVGSGGDSGAPLVSGTTKEAYAIHTHGVTPIAGVALESGTTVTRAIQMASNAGITIQLATAPV